MIMISSFKQDMGLWKGTLKTYYPAFQLLQLRAWN